MTSVNDAISALSSHDTHMVMSLSSHEHEIQAYMSAGLKIIRNIIITDGELIREEIKSLANYSPATTG